MPRPSFRRGSPGLWPHRRRAGGVHGTGQREKQAYLAQPGDIGQSDVLPFTRRPAPSPLTVSAGTFIPAEMVTGGNSDLPGPLLAMASQNAYDTAGHSHCR